MSTTITIAVIGHGDTGSLLAGELQNAGAIVIGFDTVTPKNPTTAIAESLEEAVAGADVVLAINSPTLALRTAEQVAPLLPAGAIYADLNPGTPSSKRKLAELFPEGSFADVAILGTLTETGLNTPMAVSGSAGEKLSELLTPLGLTLDYVSANAGDAAARQLIKSMLAKGITGVLIDTLWAAESMGMAQWTLEEIKREFDAFTGETAQKDLTETSVNFKRRQIEIVDIVDMLAETGFESTMLAPVQFNYGRIMHGKKIPYAKPTN